MVGLPSGPKGIVWEGGSASCCSVSFRCRLLEQEFSLLLEELLLRARGCLARFLLGLTAFFAQVWRSPPLELAVGLAPTLVSGVSSSDWLSELDSAMLTVGGCLSSDSSCAGSLRLWLASARRTSSATVSVSEAERSLRSIALPWLGPG